MRFNKAPECNVNCQPRPGDHSGKLPASQSAVLITFGIMKDPQPPPGVLGSQYGVDEMLANAVRVQTLIHDNARPPANPSQWQPRFSDMYPTSQVSQISHLSLGTYGSLSFLSPPNGHHNIWHQASQAYGHPEAAYAHKHSSCRPPSVPGRPYAPVHPTQQQNKSPVP